MGMYESRPKRKNGKDTENTMLHASGDWFAVFAAQEIAKSWKRIVIIAVLILFTACAPAIGPIVLAIRSYF